MIEVCTRKRIRRRSECQSIGSFRGEGKLGERKRGRKKQVETMSREDLEIQNRSG